MIIVEQHANVYEAAEPDPDRRLTKPTSTINRIVATVEAGETLELLGADYKKDYAAYRVRLKDGREGYIMSDVKFRRVGKSAGT